MLVRVSGSLAEACCVPYRGVLELADCDSIKTAVRRQA